MLRKFAISTLFFLTALTLSSPSQPQPDTPKPAPAKHGRGHILPPKEVSAQQHRVSNAKHGAMLKALPKATQAAYDAYAAPGGSCVPPIGDQGQCGNCYMWSGTKSCSAAQMTAGIVKPGSGFMLSVQWGLDYHPELGGCDGGDEYQVAQTIQSGGAPSVTDYPGAGQSPGTKKPTTGMTLYTVSNVVYVDPAQTDQGIASTQSIKNAILAYGYVSVAVSAGNDWDSYTSGSTLTGPNNGINHAVGATGWDDNNDNGDGSKGCFIGDNQWGTSFGNNGRFKIKYGAEGFGTEAFVTIINAPTPPPGPTPPVPPTPVPPGPVPPGPIPPGTNIVQLNAIGSDGSTQSFYPINAQTTIGQIAAALNPPAPAPSSINDWPTLNAWTHKQEQTNQQILDMLKVLVKERKP